MYSHQTDDTWRPEKQRKKTRVLSTVKGAKVEEKCTSANEGVNQGKHVGTVGAVLTQKRSRRGKPSLK